MVTQVFTSPNRVNIWTYDGVHFKQIVQSCCNTRFWGCPVLTLSHVINQANIHVQWRRVTKYRITRRRLAYWWSLLINRPHDMRRGKWKSTFFTEAQGCFTILQHRNYFRTDFAQQLFRKHNLQQKSLQIRHLLHRSRLCSMSCVFRRTVVLQDSFHSHASFVDNFSLHFLWFFWFFDFFFVYSGLECVFQIQQTDSGIMSQLFVCFWSFLEFPKVK